MRAQDRRGLSARAAQRPTGRELHVEFDGGRGRSALSVRSHSLGHDQDGRQRGDSLGVVSLSRVAHGVGSVAQQAELVRGDDGHGRGKQNTGGLAERVRAASARARRATPRRSHRRSAWPRARQEHGTREALFGVCQTVVERIFGD